MYSLLLGDKEMICKKCKKNIEFESKGAEFNWVGKYGTICWPCRDFEVHGVKHDL